MGVVAILDSTGFVSGSIDELALAPPGLLDAGTKWACARCGASIDLHAPKVVLYIDHTCPGGFSVSTEPWSARP